MAEVVAEARTAPTVSQASQAAAVAVAERVVMQLHGVTVRTAEVAARVVQAAREVWEAMVAMVVVAVGALNCSSSENSIWPGMFSPRAPMARRARLERSASQATKEIPDLQAIQNRSTIPVATVGTADGVVTEEKAAMAAVVEAAVGGRSTSPRRY